MNIDKSFFSGTDVEEAVEKASQYYNINPNFLTYKVTARDQSLFSPLSGEVTIKILSIGKKSQENAKLPKDIALVKEKLDFIIKNSGLEVEMVAARKGDTYEINISGQDADYFVEKNGALLDAFQYLLRKMRYQEERKNNFTLECKNFRKNRVMALKKMAMQAGEKVKNNGRPYVFSPMTPAERRYIHLTLQDDRMLKTESLGDGFFKRVKVFLK